MADAPEGAFSGGAVGTWLDATPISRFETTSTSGVALTAYNNDFGRWLDRSGNAKDATTTATDATRPTATNPASPEHWRFYARALDTVLSIADVGGTSATGFYFAFIGQPTNYYGELVSDVNTANTGFRLDHSADGDDVNPQYIFSAGTGSARVEVRVSTGNTLYSNPPANTPNVVECWWDGSQIHIRRDGGTAVSASCTTVSAGTSDVRLNANLGASYKGFNLYEFVLTKVHLPSSTVRDDIRTYLTNIKDNTPAQALVGQSVTVSRGAMTASSSSETSVALTGQAVTVSRGTLTPGTSVALTGQAVTVGRGSVGGNYLSTLTDDFQAASLNTAKWTASSTNGTVSIASGTLDLTTDSSAGSHATVTSVDSYSLAGSEAYLKVVRPMVGTIDADGARTVFRIFDTATGPDGDYVEWFIQSDGVVVARTCDGGTPLHNTVINSDWATSGYAWLKISMSSGTVTWWTAPDSSGSPGAWTSRHTYSTPPSAFNSVKVKLWLHHWGTGAGTITESARLDGFNTSTVSGASVALTGQAVTVSRGTPTIASSSSPTLTGQSVTVSRGTLSTTGTDVEVALVGKALSVLRGELDVFNNYLLFSSYGAVGDGVTNNLTAFQNAFADSVTTGKTVLVDVEGVYAFGGDVLRMTGAKMEGLNHNCVIHALSYTAASIFMRGTGPVLRNVKLTTAGTYGRESMYERTKIAVLGATNFTIDRVRIEVAPAASIHCAEASNNGVISNCSVYNSKSDSIHMTDRCNYIEVHHNEVYGSGDDGIACVSYQYNSSPCHHLTVHHNKVMNNVHGRGITIVGGEDNYYYQNYVEFGGAGDTTFAGLYVTAEQNPDWQTYPCKRNRLEYNTLKNCGTTTVHASIMHYSDAPVSDDNDFVRNWVTNATTTPGFRAFGPQTNTLLDQNKIDNGSGADYEGVSGDPDFTLILYDSGAYGQSEPVGPTSIVSIELTGKALTVSRGSMSALSTITAALTGHAVTAAAGTVSPTYGIAGHAVTVGRGTVVPETAVSLVGFSVTVQRNPLSPGFDQSAPLVGKAVSALGGTLTPTAAVALTGQATTTAGGTLTPGTGTSLIETLTDTFTGGTVDTTKWTAFTDGAGASVTQSGELVVDIDGDVALPASYVPYPTTGVNSTGTYKLQGSSAYVRVTPPVTTVDDWGMVQTIFGVINAGAAPDTPNDEGFGFVITSHPTKKLRFKVWNDLGDEWEVNASTEVNYDATNHKWLRLRESGGTLYWDTAPDSGPGPGTWTQRASYSTALLTNFNSVTDFLNTSRITLRVLHYDDAMQDSFFTTGAKFDGVNTNVTGPISVALTGQVVTVSRGSVVPEVGNVLTGQAVTVSYGTPTATTGSAGLSGQAVTAALGTLGVDTSVSLTGLSATVAQGAVTAGYDAALTGHALSALKGNLGHSVPGNSTPASHAVAASAGSVGIAIEVGLVGLGMTVGRSDFTADIAQAIGGYGLTVTQGSVSLTEASVALTGQAVTVGRGTVEPTLDSDIVTAWSGASTAQSPAWGAPSTDQTSTWATPSTDQSTGWTS